MREPFQGRGEIARRELLQKVGGHQCEEEEYNERTVSRKEGNSKKRTITKRRRTPM